MAYGATPDQWAALCRLGLTADLLPVVSNPTATIHPASAMKALGKTPSRYSDGMVVGIGKWTSIQATPEQVDAWSEEEDYGICLQTRQVRAIDIDIDDPKRAAAVRFAVEMALGVLPVRWRSNSGKCLLAVRVPGTISKRIIRTETGIIELLANGQQFIAAGTHPSGVPYQWETPLDEIPEVTLEQLDEVWAALAAFGTSVTVKPGAALLKARRPEDMNDPMVAWLDENGWVTDYPSDGRVDVRCPWEGEHTSDTGTSSTSWFPAGVGGFDQGHFRCLHAHCAGRTDQAFEVATGYLASGFDAAPTPAAVASATGSPIVLEEPDFERNKAGKALASRNNLLTALRRPDVCGQRLVYDEFRATVMVAEPEVGTLREIDNNDCTRLCAKLEMGPNGFQNIDSTRMRECLNLVAWENRIDSARDWITGLVWDGVPRVERFFERYFQVKASPYTAAVSLYTWTALAGRCVSPGLKCDMVPVLVGAQNAGKSTGVQAISPLKKTFVEIGLHVGDDDLARKMRGTLVAEIAELRGLDSRAEEAIKAWITRTDEVWTPKYMEYVTGYPRRLIFFGTTNRDDFLVDDTGNRRWLPMLVGEVDVKATERDRDQLWAEALALFEAGGVAWQGAYTLAKDEHEQFTASDSWEADVAQWLATDELDGPRDFVQVRDVLVSALRYELKAVKKADEMHCAKVLKRLGLQKTARWRDGRLVKGWIRATSTTS